MKVTRRAWLLGGLGVGLLAIGTYVRITDVPSQEGQSIRLDPIVGIGRTFAAGIESRTAKFADSDFIFRMEFRLRSTGANAWAGSFRVIPSSPRAKQAVYWVVLPSSATNIRTLIGNGPSTEAVLDKSETSGVLTHLKYRSKQTSDIPFMGVFFNWVDPSPIERVGYGRYRFALTYLPSHPLLPGDNMQQADVDLTVVSSDSSRFFDANPSPVTGSINTKTWRPPAGSKSSMFDGIIENERTRALANLLTELVFLGAGILLGAIAGGPALYGSKSNGQKSSPTVADLPGQLTRLSSDQGVSSWLGRTIAFLIVLDLASVSMRRYLSRRRVSRAREME
jgi:hypothetical protein